MLDQIVFGLYHGRLPGASVHWATRDPAVWTICGRCDGRGTMDRGHTEGPHVLWTLCRLEMLGERVESHPPHASVVPVCVSLSVVFDYIVCNVYHPPRGLTFTWRGCCGLRLWYKSTALTHTFLFCSCACFWLESPFNCISFHKFSQFSAFSFCSSGLISALLVHSNIYLFMRVSLSSDIILCGWLGLNFKLKQQLSK